MGPGAGEDGGHVVARGTPAEVSASERSRTAAYLKRRLGPALAGDAARDELPAARVS
jgi:excinuclease ABC subunit A